MDVETFSKIVEVLPLVSNEGFHFSCRYEPTINPKLLDLLEAIPASCRDKAFLTTNLAVPLSNNALDRLSNVNLHHINISIETFNPETYHQLCGGKFETFYRNLTQLAAIFKEARDPPKIRFITMVLKINCQELFDLALRCHREFLACEHEFRTPYYHSLNSIDPDWVEGQILNRGQLDEIELMLKKLPLTVCFDMATDERQLREYKKELGKTKNRDTNVYGVYAIKKATSIRDEELCCLHDYFYDLKIDSDGTILFYGTREQYNIKDIQQPFNFFRDRLNHLINLEASSFRYDQKVKGNLPQSSVAKIVVEEFIDLTDFLRIRGWAIVEHEDSNDYKKIIVVESDKGRYLYLARDINRPDVGQYHNNRKFDNAGFECLIKKSNIGRENFKMGVLFKPKSFLKPLYFRRYEDSLSPIVLE